MLRESPILIAMLFLFLAATVCAEIVPDYLMGTDPEFRDPALIKDFRRDFQGRWRQALQRPETDYQRLAAETVARAHAHGIPNLIALKPELEQILIAPASHPAARFAAARALIALDSRDSAPQLLDAGLKSGADLRQLVEPALAEWDFLPLRAVWIKRLDDSTTTPRDLILALRGLGRVRDAAALPAVTKISRDLLRPSHIRLEAAEAAGNIAEAGLESDAEELSRDRRLDPLVNRLCAVRLLVRHTSEQTCRFLAELAEDENPSVAAPALSRLNLLDPQRAVALAQSALSNPDPQVRQAGANAFLLVPTPDRIKPLARLLDDDHPDVRRLVGAGLCRLAAHPELSDPIRVESMLILAGSRWQGQEQAALVLGRLEHQSAANRLVALLDSTRPEVMRSTAWALRKLAVPRTIPAMVSKISRQTFERKLRKIPGVDEQVAHLFEACGQLRAQEVEPLLIQYIPKDRRMDQSRAAAFWALGRLYEGQPENPVSDALLNRIQDNNPDNPESEFVKQMCLVGLVRMKATRYAPALRETIANATPPSALGLATRWAVREMTGEELPEPIPLRVPDGEWFLEPLNPRAATP